jgi:soluble lytic murein transglycosylase
MNSQLQRYRASFFFRDYYDSLGMDGIVVSRLNNFLIRLCIGREFHPLLDLKLQELLYPMYYFDDIAESTHDTNNALWILSAFREESHFNKNSVSPSGAVGIAQIMPATATIITRNMNRDFYNCYDFRDNLEIGIFHLKYLLRKYRNNYYHALAAYNAGEPAVNRWIKKFKYDSELWVECIDFDETRDYIKKIVQTRYYYDLIYGRNSGKSL